MIVLYVPTSDHVLPRAPYRRWVFHRYAPRRRLEQALSAAVALTDTGEIGLEHLPAAIRTYVPSSLPPVTP